MTIPYDDPSLVRMELTRILIRESSDRHVVELRELHGERVFPIEIGYHEAMAIERRLVGQKPPRPYTHELMSGIIQALGARIDRIIISDLKNHTFFARLILRRDDHIYDMDARPSDAIAMGVADGVPILVAPHILDEACKPE